MYAQKLTELALPHRNQIEKQQINQLNRKLTGIKSKM